MTVDIENLEALAKGATKGEWSTSGSYISPIRREGGTTYVESWRSIALVHDDADRAFIAAANPAAVLELIAENKSGSSRLHELAVACANAEQERDQLRAEIAGLKNGYEAYERVNAELRAECEKLRKDSARYQWTSTRGNWVARFHGKWRAHVAGYADAQPTDWHPTREEAIDAAMSKDQK